MNGLKSLNISITALWFMDYIPFEGFVDDTPFEGFEDPEKISGNESSLTERCQEPEVGRQTVTYNETEGSEVIEPTLKESHLNDDAHEKLVKENDGGDSYGAFISGEESRNKASIKTSSRALLRDSQDDRRGYATGNQQQSCQSSRKKKGFRQDPIESLPSYESENAESDIEIAKAVKRIRIAKEAEEKTVIQYNVLNLQSPQKKYNSENNSVVSSNPIFLEPFKHEFKRELVQRSVGNVTDVYYFSPQGKRLRSLNEVASFLRNKDYPLTLRNFTFQKLLVSGDPEFEVKRNSLLKQTRQDFTAAIPSSKRKTEARTCTDASESIKDESDVVTSKTICHRHKQYYYKNNIISAIYNVIYNPCSSTGASSTNGSVNKVKTLKTVSAFDATKNTSVAITDNSCSSRSEPSEGSVIKRNRFKTKSPISTIKNTSGTITDNPCSSTGEYSKEGSVIKVNTSKVASLFGSRDNTSDAIADNPCSSTSRSSVKGSVITVNTLKNMSPFSKRNDDSIAVGDNPCSATTRSSVKGSVIKINTLKNTSIAVTDNAVLSTSVKDAVLTDPLSLTSSTSEVNIFDTTRSKSKERSVILDDSASLNINTVVPTEQTSDDLSVTFQTKHISSEVSESVPSRNQKNQCFEKNAKLEDSSISMHRSTISVRKPSFLFPGSHFKQYPLTPSEISSVTKPLVSKHLFSIPTLSCSRCCGLYHIVCLDVAKDVAKQFVCPTCQIQSGTSSNSISKDGSYFLNNGESSINLDGKNDTASFENGGSQMPFATAMHSKTDLVTSQRTGKTVQSSQIELSHIHNMYPKNTPTVETDIEDRIYSSVCSSVVNKSSKTNSRPLLKKAHYLHLNSARSSKESIKPLILKKSGPMMENINKTLIERSKSPVRKKIRKHDNFDKKLPIKMPIQVAKKFTSELIVLDGINSLIQQNDQEYEEVDPLDLSKGNDEVYPLDLCTNVLDHDMESQLCKENSEPILFVPNSKMPACDVTTEQVGKTQSWDKVNVIKRNTFKTKSPISTIKNTSVTITDNPYSSTGEYSKDGSVIKVNTSKVVSLFGARDNTCVVIANNPYSSTSRSSVKGSASGQSVSVLPKFPSQSSLPLTASKNRKISSGYPAFGTTISQSSEPALLVDNGNSHFVEICNEDKVSRSLVSSRAKLLLEKPKVEFSSDPGLSKSQKDALYVGMLDHSFEEKITLSNCQSSRLQSSFMFDSQQKGQGDRAGVRPKSGILDGSQKIINDTFVALDVIDANEVLQAKFSENCDLDKLSAILERLQSGKTTASSKSSTKSMDACVQTGTDEVELPLSTVPAISVVAQVSGSQTIEHILDSQNRLRRFIVVSNATFTPERPCAFTPFSEFAETIPESAHVPEVSITSMACIQPTCNVEVSQKEGATTSPWFSDFVNSFSCAYTSLLHVFSFLSPAERGQAALTCKFWYKVANTPSLWKHIDTRKLKVRNICNFLSRMRKLEIESIDLRGLDRKHHRYLLEYFNVPDAKKLFMCPTEGGVIENIFRSCHDLVHLDANNVSASSINLKYIKKHYRLQKLVLNFSTRTELSKLSSLKKLHKMKHLSLRGISNIYDVAFLEFMPSLEFLSLGSLSSLDESLFQESTFKNIKHLKHLNVSDGPNWDTNLSILHSIGSLDQIVTLEVVYFRVDCSLYEVLSLVPNLQKFLFVPVTSVGTMATVLGDLLEYLPKLCKLKQFCLVLPEECVLFDGTLVVPRKIIDRISSGIYSQESTAYTDAELLAAQVDKKNGEEESQMDIIKMSQSDKSIGFICANAKEQRFKKDEKKETNSEGMVVLKSTNKIKSLQLHRIEISHSDEEPALDCNKSSKPTYQCQQIELPRTKQEVALKSKCSQIGKYLPLSSEKSEGSRLQAQGQDLADTRERGNYASETVFEQEFKVQETEKSYIDEDSLLSYKEKVNPNLRIEEVDMSQNESHFDQTFPKKVPQCKNYPLVKKNNCKLTLDAAPSLFRKTKGICENKIRDDRRPDVREKNKKLSGITEPIQMCSNHMVNVSSSMNMDKCAKGMSVTNLRRSPSVDNLCTVTPEELCTYFKIILPSIEMCVIVSNEDIIRTVSLQDIDWKNGCFFCKLD